jgi:hypothetical protein
MNLCVCCNREIELPEGSQVCYQCLNIAKEDRKTLASITLEEIDRGTLVPIENLQEESAESIIILENDLCC